MRNEKSIANKSKVAILIKGLILSEFLLLTMKKISCWGLKYRGYGALGGEFLVIPLMFIVRVLYVNIKDIFEGGEKNE